MSAKPTHLPEPKFLRRPQRRLRPPVRSSAHTKSGSVHAPPAHPATKAIDPRRWLLLASVLLGVALMPACSPAKTNAPASPDAFAAIVAQVNERAAAKSTANLHFTVTRAGDPAAPDGAGAPVRIIEVRKEPQSGGAAAARSEHSVMTLHFARGPNDWQCVKATSTDFEGDKIVGENSISGQPLELANVFRWMGL